MSSNLFGLKGQPSVETVETINKNIEDEDKIKEFINNQSEL